MHPSRGILAIVVVLMLAASTAGCIEQRDKPESGDFTIEAQSQPLFIVEASGEVIQGPHAHVVTDLHHEHPEYQWRVGDSEPSEGTEVEVTSAGPKLLRASYLLEYYGLNESIEVYVAAVPNATGTFVVIADGTALEDEANASGVGVGHDAGLVVLDQGPLGTLFEAPNGPDVTVTLNISLPDDGGPPAAYVFGYQQPTGNVPIRWTGAVAIHPGENHSLVMHSSFGLLINVTRASDPGNFTLIQNVTDIPEDYHTELGSLEWEGEVGEEEEVPGPSAVVATTALVSGALVAALGRRLRTGSRS